MSDRSNVLTQLNIERARHDREWEASLDALDSLESNSQLMVAQNALDDLESAFGPVRVCRSITNALRA